MNLFYYSQIMQESQCENWHEVRSIPQPSRDPLLAASFSAGIPRANLSRGSRVSILAEIPKI